MKIKNIIFRFAFLTAVASVAGCVKPGADDADQTRVADEDMIALRADLKSVSVEVDTDTQTRAPVLSWHNDRVAFAYGNTPNDYHVQWNALIMMHGDVIFSPVRPYNAENLVMHLKGFHPRGQVRGGDYNKVYFNLTGNEDIMVSQDVNIGNLENKKSDVVARFEHKLSQFQFKASNSQLITTGSPESLFPMTGRLYKITLTGTESTPIRSEAMIDLTDNSISFSGDPSTIVVYENEKGVQTSKSDNFLNPVPVVMFEPGKKMQVTLEYGENDGIRKSVTKDIATLPEQGYAYEITFNFSGTGIYLSLYLTGWKAATVSKEAMGGEVVLW